MPTNTVKINKNR